MQISRRSFFAAALAVALVSCAAHRTAAATYEAPPNVTWIEVQIGDGGGHGGGGGLQLAQFSDQQQPKVITPAPGPAIGQSGIGSPTYVVPPSTKAGGFINVGQAFNEAAGPYVDAIVQAVLAALIGWAALRFQQATGIKIDGEHRAALTTFLQNQAGSLIADGKVKVAGLKVQVNDEALANAANSALSRIPDAMKAFGLTPETIEKKIVDAIPQTAAGAQIVAQAHEADAAPAAPPVVTAPRAPAPVAPAPVPPKTT